MLKHIQIHNNNKCVAVAYLYTYMCVSVYNLNSELKYGPRFYGRIVHVPAFISTFTKCSAGKTAYKSSRHRRAIRHLNLRSICFLLGGLEWGICSCNGTRFHSSSTHSPTLSLIPHPVGNQNTRRLKFKNSCNLVSTGLFVSPFTQRAATPVSRSGRDLDP